MKRFAETIEDLKVRKPQPENLPTDYDGRYKRLADTPDDEYGVDSGAWPGTANGVPIVAPVLRGGI